RSTTASASASASATATTGFCSPRRASSPTSCSICSKRSRRINRCSIGCARARANPHGRRGRRAGCAKRSRCCSARPEGRPYWNGNSWRLHVDPPSRDAKVTQGEGERLRSGAHRRYHVSETFSSARCLYLQRRDGRMTYIDAVILDLTEWACRRFQVVTGRTNVWLAVQLTNLSIILYFLWAMMSFWNDVSMRFAVGLFCAGLSYILTQTVLKDP